MAVKKIQVWLTDGTMLVTAADIPAVLPGGVPNEAEYVRTQLIYADEMASVFSYGLGNTVQEPPGEFIRMGNVQRFRILDSE